MRITTKNGAPIVSREDYVDATYALTNPAAAVPTVALNGKIRGRGHSTWGQPKNPYKVQFSNDAAYAAMIQFGSDVKPALGRPGLADGGMPANDLEEDDVWAIITYLRNQKAHEAHELPHEEAAEHK